MASQVAKLRLFVDTSDICIEILKYFDKCVPELNKTGAKVFVTKFEENDFDEETVHMLRQHGITRLPALTGGAKTALMGISQICGYVDSRIKSDNRKRTIGGGAGFTTEVGSNADLSDFWAQEMYAGFDERTRRRIPRRDEDENDEDNAKDDIDRKLREYNRNPPRHRRAESGRNMDPIDDDYDRARSRGRNGRNARPTPRRREEPRYDDEDEDNIADSDDDEPRMSGRAGGSSNRAPASGDDMDDQMMSAWMENNPGSSDY